MPNEKSERRAAAVAAVLDDYIDTSMDRFLDAVSSVTEHPADPKLQEMLGDTLLSLDVLLRVRARLPPEGPRPARRARPR